MRTLRICLQATIVTWLLTGIAYPLAMTGLAGALFPERAAGSLVHDGRGRAVGSTLIGQSFTHPSYFQGRPSAAGAGYDASSSGGSNLGPTSAKLRERAKSDVERLRRENPHAPLPIPAELVTASASGLDPHLTPGAARWQVGRIARSRNVSEDRVNRLLDDLTQGRQLGFLGEPRVNVLALNLALDRQFGRPGAGADSPASQ